MASRNDRRPLRAARAGRRSGIALVITLGFLALMLIMAVGFSISMRVERLATRSYVDLARSRQLIDVALARALERIAQDTSSGNGMTTRSAVFWTIGGTPCPQIFDSGATNYIPLSVLGSLRYQNSVQWESITDPKTEGKQIGHYAFVAYDCSGLLDANLDHGRFTNDLRYPVPRVNINEAILTNNPALDFRKVFGEMNKSEDWAWCRRMFTILTNADEAGSYYAANVPGGSVRIAVGRYDTLKELSAFGGLPIATRWTNYLATPRGFFDPRAFPTNFITFSRYPQGLLDKNRRATNAMSLVRLGEEVSLGQKNSPLQNDILRQMERMGLKSDEATILLNCLVDYADTNQIPLLATVSAPSSESVPMLNEIVVEIQFDGDGNLQYWVTGEVVFPFLNAEFKGDVSMRMKTTVTCPDASPEAMDETLPLNANWKVDADAPQPVFAVQRYGPKTITFTDPKKRNPDAAVISVRAQLKSGDYTIDQVMPDLVFRVGDFRAQGRHGRGADDPRLNWDGSDGAGQWKHEDEAQRQITLGAPNKMGSVCTWDQPERSGTPFMYCANSNLTSVGELSYLHYRKDRPWWTLSIAGSETYPVFGAFTLLDPVTNDGVNAVVYGLVNPNGLVNILKDGELGYEVPGPLAAVFNGMRIERYPGDERAHELTADEALSLARKIINERHTFTNAGDFASTAGVRDAIRSELTGILGGRVDGYQVNSVVRNSGALISARQQLFTILLAAQSTDADGAQPPLGEQHAVALVWRDPFPNADGQHEIVVRYLKYLND